MVRCPLPLRPFEFLLIDRYPKLRELELRQLERALLSSDSSPVLVTLKAKINSHANGQFSHAEDVLPALYELMESEEQVGEVSLPIVVSTNQQVVGGDWN